MRRYGYRPDVKSGQSALKVGDRVSIYELSCHVAGSITRTVLWPKGSITYINKQDNTANVQWDMGGGSQHTLDKLNKL